MDRWINSRSNKVFYRGKEKIKFIIDMRQYRITLTYKDLNESTGVSNCTNYDKDISENLFNEIYKLICK